MSAPTDFRYLVPGGKPRRGKALPPEISYVISWNRGFLRSMHIGRLVEGSPTHERTARRSFG